ncbi:SRSF protein kinase 3-like isoform X2 [Coccinella septempunctata]|uniref:SRSF protein kinase 3-like isoform X2 n=1 Tax=Coccinella septempunctata TaxID=41139 RepID=UPI001D086AB0|nr:SRSF protein kinase 3-like isoform X2 [Coccinella septempunctata]
MFCGENVLIGRYKIRVDIINNPIVRMDKNQVHSDYCYANETNYYIDQQLHESADLVSLLYYVLSFAGMIVSIYFLHWSTWYAIFYAPIKEEETERNSNQIENIQPPTTRKQHTLRSASCCRLISVCSPKEIEDYDVGEIKEIADCENKSYPQQEDPAEYCPGGYMPISYKTILGDKYHVVRKLGYGHFSTVWLCENIANKEYVAVKVCKSATVFTAVAQDEIKLLQCTRDKNPDHPGSRNIVQMLDFFNCHSINGNHTAIAFEIMGPSLLHLIIQSDYQGIHIPGVKTIVRQVLEGLVYLHDECNIIHTDIKPENILIKVKDSYVKKMVSTTKKFYDLGVLMPKSYVAADRWTELCSPQEEEVNDETFEWTRNRSFPEDYNLGNGGPIRRSKEGTIKGAIWIDPNIEVKIADLGNACWDDHHFTNEIQTKQYRALEVILDAGYSFPADIWSLGCVAFELATGEYLFNPKRYQRCSATADHLTLIWEVLDGIPPYITSKGRNAIRYFDNGRLRHVEDHYLKIWKIEDVLVDKYDWKRIDAIPFASFVESMIEPDPQLRITAAAALQSSWLNE